MDVRFSLKLGRIDTKWDKSGNLEVQFSVFFNYYFGSVRQNRLIFKIPRFVKKEKKKSLIFCLILCQFMVKSDISDSPTVEYALTFNHIFHFFLLQLSVCTVITMLVTIHVLQMRNSRLLFIVAII